MRIESSFPRPVEFATEEFFTATPVALPVLLPTPAPPLLPEERWAWIVQGEAGGGWSEGAALVAWTLRAWEFYRGMEPAAAGPGWGWYGWARPDPGAREAVRAAWGRPPPAAPFAFMAEGRWCAKLGNNTDVGYWQRHAYVVGEPDFRLAHPNPKYSARIGLNCYLD